LHHKAVADAVNIPQILYNVPGRTSCDMKPETVGRLSGISNIIAIKEATGELDRIDDIKNQCPDDFILLSGDDETACEFMIKGGQGVISVTANIAPSLMHEMCTLVANGEYENARKLNTRLDLLNKKLFLEANPIPVKWAVHRLGMIDAGIRLPLTWMSKNFEPEIEDAMRHAGII
jgi:4-hydroxy-tetrahydrodipicolinate synthase